MSRDNRSQDFISFIESFVRRSLNMPRKTANQSLEEIKQEAELSDMAIKNKQNWECLEHHDHKCTADGEWLNLVCLTPKCPVKEGMINSRVYQQIRGRKARSGA